MISIPATDPGDRLPGHTNALVDAVIAANPSTIVVHLAGTPNELPWISRCSTLLHMGYGGNSTGEALADVLFGLANPSGRLPFTWPEKLEDVPSFLTFGGEASTGNVSYGEGVFVGYKGFEAMDRDPLFPFGFGLSLGKPFVIEMDAIEPGFAATKFFIDLSVCNPNAFAGAEVVQVYVVQPTSVLRRRPRKELAAFKKVELEEEQLMKVEISNGVESLASWDEGEEEWVVEKGTYEVLVGVSSVDIRARGSWAVDQRITWVGCIRAEPNAM